MSAAKCWRCEFMNLVQPWCHDQQFSATVVSFRYFQSMWNLCYFWNKADWWVLNWNCLWTCKCIVYFDEMMVGVKHWMSWYDWFPFDCKVMVYYKDWLSEKLNCYNDLTFVFGCSIVLWLLHISRYEINEK